MKQETICVDKTTLKQLNSSRFTSELTVLYYFYQNTVSIQQFVPFFSCRAADQINCKYVLLRRQKYGVFLSPCLLQPFPLLINFQLCLTLTPNNHLSPLYSPPESILPWKFFRGNISFSG